MRTPLSTEETSFGTKSWLRRGSNLPLRGPTLMTPMTAAAPPTRWTTVLPAKSWKGGSSWLNHPPPNSTSRQVRTESQRPKWREGCMKESWCVQPLRKEERTRARANVNIGGIERRAFSRRRLRLARARTRSGDDGCGSCLEHKMVKKGRDVRIVERMADIDAVREVEAPEIRYEGAEDHIQDILRVRRHDVILSTHAPLQQCKAKLHEEDESRGQNLQGSKYARDGQPRKGVVETTLKDVPRPAPARTCRCRAPPEIPCWQGTALL